MNMLTVFKVKKLNKGRREKRRLTCRRHKQLKPLKPMIERYTDVLAAAVDSGQSTVSRILLQPATFNLNLASLPSPNTKGKFIRRCGWKK